LTEIDLLKLHQNLRIIRGIKHPWAAPVVKPKVEGNYATIVMFAVVVNTGLVVVERRIAVVTKQVRETGAGYPHENEKSHKCVYCQKVEQPNEVFKQCSGSKAVRYCGQRCQKLHWSSHKSLCQAIEHLETQKRSQVERGDSYVFASHL